MQVPTAGITDIETLRRFEVLAESSLRQAIREHSISITYWDFLATPIVSSLVDLDDPDDWAYAKFNRDTFGGRLSLDVGPVVLSHNHRWKRGHRRFKSFAGVFDLRQSEGKYRIDPGESVTINAAQSIRFDGEIAALVVPRLTHATAGLALTTSYIDPCWDGIPVVHLQNTSPRPYVIEMGEKFAVLFFFDLKGQPQGDLFRREFANKSHHFGLNWRRVLDEDAHPFPMRKVAGPSPIRDLVDDGPGLVLSRFWKPLTASGVSIALLASVLFASGVYANRLNSLEEQLGDAGSLDTKVAELERQLADVSSQARSGSLDVRIPQGQRVAEERVPLGDDARGATVVTGVIRGSVPAIVEGDVVGSDLVVTVRLLMPSPAGGAAIEVAWLAET